MQLLNPNSDVFVPDGLDPGAAASRTTHLCIGAHQDDIEIMAYHGIAACFGRRDKWMSGVIVTDGAGSARSGIYSDYSDEKMKEIRRHEQRKAAVVGEYALQVQLGYSSSQVKDPESPSVTRDLLTILNSTRPRIVYLHNPADKHDTHIAVLLKAIAALRQMEAETQPEQVYGCEVWRDLDWILDEDKEVLSVSDFPNIASSLVGVFDSQITGGKRYDLATAGRRLANATYYQSHATDREAALTFALNLTPMVLDKDLGLADFVNQYMQRFQQDVESRIRRLEGKD